MKWLEASSADSQEIKQLIDFEFPQLGVVHLKMNLAPI